MGFPDPSLPQTYALPPASSPQLTAVARALWSGITTGSLSAAMPAFFPEAAYVQVKALANPAGDWQYRLVDHFALDLAAAHAYISGAPATLVGITVVEGEAAWIPPGACYNAVGYWHDPGVRLLYDQGGVLRSIGIKSLISWRGVWYVVHLGTLDRTSATGVVDSPAVGAGVPGPPGGC